MITTYVYDGSLAELVIVHDGLELSDSLVGMALLC
jgi:hypothetical protein